MTPKTEMCCGQKPKRMFYQTGYRDDEGKFSLTCRVCRRTVTVENNYRGTAQVEIECVNQWNQGIIKVNPTVS